MLAQGFKDTVVGMAAANHNPLSLDPNALALAGQTGFGGQSMLSPNGNNKI